MPYDRMESAAYLSSFLARSFARSFSARAAGIGFLPGQFPVLLELWNNDGLTQRELLDRLQVEQATLANTLARMERDGLIERRAHPTDRRAVQNFLTERGREMEAARQTDQDLFAGFRRFERELMLEYMRRAIDNLRKIKPPDELQR
jgi:DNA-binding MarR family transcriptional regulator